MLRWRQTVLFLFVPGLLHAAAPPMVLKYRDLKNLVESQNEKILAKKSEHTAANHRQGTLVRSFFPSAHVYAGQEVFRRGPLSTRSQPTYGAELTLNLFNGGRDQIDDERSSVVSEAARFETINSIASELGKARELYWRILYVRDSIELLKEARVANAESLKAAERRIRSGVATETDRIEFEMRGVDLKQELERAELEKVNLTRHLAAAIGMDPTTKLDFPEALEHEHDWANMVKHTEEDHAFLVKPAQLRAEEIEALAKSQGRGWIPKVDVFAAYNQLTQREELDFEDPADRQESVVGVRMTLDLSHGFSSQRESRALVSEAAAARSEAKHLQLETEAHLHGEIAELNLLHQQVHEAEGNVTRAEKYFQLTRTQYARGVKNSTDMVGATDKFLRMKQGRLQIIRDFQIAKSHVLAKIGK